MNQPNQPRSIEVDYRGKPITSGIPVRNNTEYVAKAGAGIVILHFIFHPILVGYLIGLMLLGIPFLTPGLTVTALYAHHVLIGSGTLIVGLVLLSLGLFFWLRLSWRLTKKIVKGFTKHAQFRFVGDYQGPLSSH